MKLTVKYEFPANPTSVIMEVVCHSVEEQEAIYQERKANSQYKNVKKSKTSEDIWK